MSRSSCCCCRPICTSGYKKIIWRILSARWWRNWPLRRYEDYDSRGRAQPAYDARMIVNLVLYAYSVGTASSRKIEQAAPNGI